MEQQELDEVVEKAEVKKRISMNVRVSWGNCWESERSVSVKASEGSHYLSSFDEERKALDFSF